MGRRTDGQDIPLSNELFQLEHIDRIIEYTESCIDAIQTGRDLPPPTGEATPGGETPAWPLISSSGSMRCWLQRTGEPEFQCTHHPESFNDCTRCEIYARAADTPEKRLMEHIYILAGELSRRRKELEITRGMLDQREELARLGQQVSAVAHELNNIVGSIMGYAQLAKLTGEEQDVAKFIEVALMATGRAKSILGGLRSANRQRKKHGIQHVQEILDVVALHLTHDMQKNRVVIRRDYHEVPWIVTDPINLQRVVLSICSHLVKDMDDEGRIDLSIRHRGEWVEVKIAGETATPEGETAQLTFDEFFPVQHRETGSHDMTETAFRENQEIVSDLGGRLRARSPNRNKTVFTLQLPLSQ